MKLIIFILTIFTIIPTFVFAQDFIFTRTLKAGMRGEDVRILQEFLNENYETLVANTGAGSTGYETTYFGPATKRALIKFQEKYNTEILSPFGLTFGTGILGPKTREKINTLIKEKGQSVIATNIIPNTNANLIEQENSGLPIHIKIPKINIDSDIQYVGLTTEGTMDVPKGPNDIGWFDLGTKPGEIGSAVIAGHSGWKDNIPAAFDDLGKLEKGDKIYVENKKGEIITFVVRESRIYDPEADATNVFSSSDGKAHLNLITCVGTWDIVKKSRSNRLVVFTDKIE